MRNKIHSFYRYLILGALLSFFVVSANVAISAETPASATVLSIPESYGAIKEQSMGNYDNSLVVLIQDLHCNYDAQMSIYKIIDKLIKEENFKLVTIEGPTGRLDTAPFCKYSNDEIKERVAKHFLKSGSINGAGYAHIMNKGSFAFWGVDDPVLYQQGTDAFMTALKTRSENSVFCGNIKTILDELKLKAYNKNLLHFDNQSKAYKEDKISLGEFADYLNELLAENSLSKEPYVNFNKLIEVLKIEKTIDFTSVDTERSECIEVLSKKLKDKDLSQLLEKSLHFKTQTIGAVEFYSYLKDTVEKNPKKITFEKYPQLYKYISYILSYNTIDHAKLFEEIDSIQSAVKEKLFTRQLERDIDISYRNIDILNNLSGLKLTTKTLDIYRKDRSAFLASRFVTFINENAPKYKIRYTINPVYRKIDEQLPDLERFYAAALERDKALVDNTINRMNQLSTKKAILVAGGFHTEGITNALKKKGVSYMVITPKVNEVDDKNSLYMSVMLGKKTMMEQIFYGQLKNGKVQNADAVAFQQAARYYADIIYKTILDIEKENKEQ